MFCYFAGGEDSCVACRRRSGKGCSACKCVAKIACRSHNQPLSDIRSRTTQLAQGLHGMHVDLNPSTLSADDEQCQMQGFVDLYVCQYVLYRAYSPDCINAVNVLWSLEYQSIGRRRVLLLCKSKQLSQSSCFTKTKVLCKFISTVACYQTRAQAVQQSVDTADRLPQLVLVNTVHLQSLLLWWSTFARKTKQRPVYGQQHTWQ